MSIIMLLLLLLLVSVMIHTGLCILARQVHLRWWSWRTLVLVPAPVLVPSLVHGYGSAGHRGCCRRVTTRSRHHCCTSCGCRVTIGEYSYCTGKYGRNTGYGTTLLCSD